MALMYRATLCDSVDPSPLSKSRNARRVIRLVVVSLGRWAYVWVVASWTPFPGSPSSSTLDVVQHEDCREAGAKKGSETASARYGRATVVSRSIDD